MEKSEQKANELHNKANDLKINKALESRLSPLHYQLLNKVSEGDLVDFRLAPDYYLVAVEDGKVYLELMKRENPEWEKRKGLHGASYPVPSIVGYYFRYLTLETTGRSDWGDAVLISPSSRAGGVINIPLEVIISYEIIRKEAK